MRAKLRLYLLYERSCAHHRYRHRQILIIAAPNLAAFLDDNLLVPSRVAVEALQHHGDEQVQNDEGEQARVENEEENRKIPRPTLNRPLVDALLEQLRPPSTRFDFQVIYTRLE